MEEKELTIELADDRAGLPRTLTVRHTDETFGFTLGDKTITILNNGDNSWSLVSGTLSQEKVNTVGQAIEAWYRSQPL